jgi:predicted nucleic acid-binding protein
MNGRAFLDTNILVYFYSEDDENKRNKARQVLDDNDCVTSLQAMNEASNVWLRKFSLSPAQIIEHLDNIESVCDAVFPIDREVIDKALYLRERYGFSYFDCLMLASALESGCETLFTEDMSDGQLIEKTLKIVNPFK